MSKHNARTHDDAGHTDEEFKPKIFGRHCPTCRKVQTFEVDYDIQAIPRLDPEGRMMDIQIVIEAKGSAYCMHCRTMIFIAEPAGVRYEALQQAIQAARRRAAAGIVLPKGAASDIVVPGR